jgi:hypothetical protein
LWHSSVALAPAGEQLLVRDLTPHAPTGAAQ